MFDSVAGMTEDERREIDALKRQVTELQQKVEFLYRQLGVTYSSEPPPDDDVAQLILADNRIGAIKRHREKTGDGLKEAKEFVDALAARLGR